MSVKVEVKSDAFKDLVGRLSKPEPLLEKIGQYLADSTRARIRTTKTSPDGTPWAAWAPSTYLARAKSGSLSGGLLLNTGRLLNSVEYRTVGDGVEVMASAPAARFLQLGTAKMPARPFLGISSGDEEAIAGLVRRHFVA